MPITEELLEVKEHTAEGYKPVIDFEAWRVAVLNYSPELLPVKSEGSGLLLTFASSARP